MKVPVASRLTLTGKPSALTESAELMDRVLPVSLERRLGPGERSASVPRESASTGPREP